MIIKSLVPALPPVVRSRSGHSAKALSLAIHSLLFSPLMLSTPQALAAEDSEGTVEEIVVTARFREERLQETPLAITAISGEELEARGLNNIVDLGMAIPNSSIRESGNQWGPTPNVGMRGVQTTEFIYTSEPGVGIYIDDVYHGTLTGSNLDLIDVERVEVLRGPQGTLFGKNSLGGAIRMISKAPRGEDIGSLELTAGTSNRLDFRGSFDMSLIPDELFMRISGSSKQIDGYQDVLDYTCQMIKNGTPELAGSLPRQQPGSQQLNDGNCKISENGGSESKAGRVMLRWLASDTVEVNWAADYSKTNSQPGTDALLKGQNPTDFFHSLYVNNVIMPRFGITYLDDRFVTGDPFVTYADRNDPLTGARWPTDQITESWSQSLKVDWDIGDNMHLKAVYAYYTYDSDWASDGDFTPFDTSTTLNNQEHDQTTFEIQLSGLALNDKLEWTTGLFTYESDSHLGGFVTLPQLTPAVIPSNFAQDDYFTNTTDSAFVHGVYDITDKLSFTAGVRWTDEAKTYGFSHYFVVPEPLTYGEENIDYKVSLDYQYDDETLVYLMSSTGFRSVGANPRPFTIGQLQPFPGEELTAYELGIKTDLFNNSLRVNTAFFINDYDPRATGAFGRQCNLVTDPDPGPRYDGVNICPAGTPMAGTPGAFWFDQITTSGEAKGAEVEVTWNPLDFLSINGTWGYYDYEPDAGPGEPGFLHPDYLEQPQYSWSLGGQYSFHFNNGSMLTPRLDWFYVGERTNGAPASPMIRPYHYVPDYDIMNARITYVPGDGDWTLGLAISNLRDDFYWINLGSERATNGIDPSYNRSGTFGRGREMALTFSKRFE
jgi:iron complex outermembrane receptor protein